MFVVCCSLFSPTTPPFKHLSPLIQTLPLQPLCVPIFLTPFSSKQMEQSHCLVQKKLAPCTHTPKPTKTTSIVVPNDHLVNNQENMNKNKKIVVVKNNQEKKKLDDDEQVKLAALAITFNIRLRAADMPSAMQERALRHARALLDAASDRRRPNPTLLARSLKKEFDSVYGPAWHCVAGKSFGSFVTHSPGGFVYFSIDTLSFLLFKTEVHVIVKQPSSKLQDLLKIN